MKRYLPALAIALLPTATMAQDRIGNWSTEFNQGTLAYNLKGSTRASDMVSIQCAQNGAAVAVTLNGRPTSLNHEFTVQIDRERFKLFNADGDLVATDTAIGRDAFRHFWTKLRAGNHMTIRFDDGRVGHFNLRGSARMLPRKACQTEYP